MVAFIKRKLGNKYLPEHYLLLVHGNRNDKVNTEEVFRELTSCRLRLGEVWLLVHVEDETRQRFVVVCLYPSRAASSFLWDEELARNRVQPEMMSMSRGKGKIASRGILRLKFPELE